MTSTATLAPEPLSFVPDQLAPVRVFVADDHDLYRRVVIRAIEANPALTLVGQAADGYAALAGICLTEPDVALLDLRMPGLDGLEVCRRAHAAMLDLSVVILTAFDDDDTVLRALDAGASACLGKDAAEAEICAAAIRAGDA